MTTFVKSTDIAVSTPIFNADNAWYGKNAYLGLTTLNSASMSNAVVQNTLTVVGGLSVGGGITVGGTPVATTATMNTVIASLLMPYSTTTQMNSALSSYVPYSALTGSINLGNTTTTFLTTQNSIYVNGMGTALNVTNNASIGGSITVTNNASIGGSITVNNGATINGTLSVSKNINLTYTNLPTLTPQSIGYMFSGAFGAVTITSVAIAQNISSIVLPAGVWYIEFYCYTSTITTSGTAVNIAISTVSSQQPVPTGLNGWTTYANQQTNLRMSAMFSLTTGTTIYFTGLCSQSGITMGGGYQATRIA
jgi:hypothetical protein